MLSRMVVLILVLTVSSLATAQETQSKFIEEINSRKHNNNQQAVVYAYNANDCVRCNLMVRSAFEELEIDEVAYLKIVAIVGSREVEAKQTIKENNLVGAIPCSEAEFSNIGVILNGPTWLLLDNENMLIASGSLNASGIASLQTTLIGRRANVSLEFVKKTPIIEYPNAILVNPKFGNVSRNTITFAYNNKYGIVDIHSGDILKMNTIDSDELSDALTGIERFIPDSVKNKAPIPLQTKIHHCYCRASSDTLLALVEYPFMRYQHEYINTLDSVPKSEKNIDPNAIRLGKLPLLVHLDISSSQILAVERIADAYTLQGGGGYGVGIEMTDYLVNRISVNSPIYSSDRNHESKSWPEYISVILDLKAKVCKYLYEADTVYRVKRTGYNLANTNHASIDGAIYGIQYLGNKLTSITTGKSVPIESIHYADPLSWLPDPPLREESEMEIGERITSKPPQGMLTELFILPDSSICVVGQSNKPSKGSYSFISVYKHPSMEYVGDVVIPELINKGILVAALPLPNSSNEFILIIREDEQYNITTYKLFLR